MTVISLNVEGLSADKEDFIAKMCFKHKCSVLCLQETHSTPQSHRPKVNGMTCNVEFLHDQHGSAIFVKEGINIESIHTDDQSNIKILKHCYHISVQTTSNTFQAPTTVPTAQEKDRHWRF